jgi:ribosomal protein L31E
LDYENFLRLVKTRKSVRRYKSEPVPEGVLEKILFDESVNTFLWENTITRIPKS